MKKIEIPKNSIVLKYVLTVGLALLAVSAAGIWSSSNLLSDMAALSDDERLLTALKEGRDGFIDFRDHRNSMIERIVAACVQDKQGPNCPMLSLALGFDPEVATIKVGAPPLPEGWVDEGTYVINVRDTMWVLKFHWSELKTKYQDISEVIKTREHLIDVFPKVRQSFITVCALSIGSVGCLGLAVVFVLSRHLRRRVWDLTNYAHQLSGGDLLPAPANTSGSDEIGLLSAAMEKMAKDLAETREKLVFTQKMQSWQAVARKVAHEIKNPLTPITVVAEQLHRCQGQGGPQLQEILAEASRILYDEAGALGRMVKEFTAFARLPDPHLEHLDAVGLVRDFINRNTRHGGPSFVLRLGVTSCGVMADRGMLMQVLHNIVNNAVLAKGPDIVTVIFTVSTTANHFILDLGDDGPGVPEFLRASLFDAYVTSRSTGEGQKGMGLGLTISRKIATDHGGNLKLLSTGQNGSVFRLELPMAVFSARSFSTGYFSKDGGYGT